MNDQAVHDILQRLATLERRIEHLELRCGSMEAQIRARLKEEAESRQKWKGLGGGYHGTGRV